MSSPPLCATGADMKRLDGQVVRLVGIYKKKLSAKKQGRPATEFFGYVNIELEGKATDYDSSAWEGAPAAVELPGRRSDQEVDTFAGKKVVVEGKLVLDPSRGSPAPDHAAEAPEPTLVGAKPVQLAGQAL